MPFIGVNHSMIKKLENLTSEVTAHLFHSGIYLVLFLAFILRINGINFGSPYFLVQDEGHLVNQAYHILQSHDFNPHWFNWPGSTLLYQLVGFYTAILYLKYGYAALSGQEHPFLDFMHNAYAHPSLFYLSGRFLVILYGLATIYVLYRLGEKVFNKTVGLLAGFVLAISPLHVARSRMIRPDVVGLFMVLLSYYFILESAENKNKEKNLFLSCFLCGLAGAAKYPYILMAIPIFVLGLISLKANSLHKRIEMKQISNLGAKVVFYTLIGFFCGAPFLLTDIRIIPRALLAQGGKTMLGGEGIPGWENLTWYLGFALRRGIGVNFFNIFAGLGFIPILLEKSRKKLCFFLFPLLMLMAMSISKTRWYGWILPILPFTAILFSIATFSSYSFLKERFFSKSILVPIFVVTIGLFSRSAVSECLSQGNLMNRPTTGMLAKDWIEKNLPEDSRISFENAILMPSDPQKKIHHLFEESAPLYSIPWSHFQDQKIEYLLISKWKKDSCYLKSEKYTAQIRWYEELKKKAKRIKVIDDKKKYPGARIEIYQFYSAL